MIRIILLSLFLCSTLATVHFEIDPIDLDTTSLPVKELLFQQYRDHFVKKQLGKFNQRYWEMMEYWDPKAPKAILYICGESVGRFPAETTLPVVAAKEVKAAVFSLEHRYYGISQPFPDWSVEHLTLLTYQQGLADIAYFIESTNVEFNKTYGVVPKWVVIGGSYAGAMSAWFRYIYPHLVSGAISSSGVVNAIADFQDFEKHFVDVMQKCDGEPQGWAVKLLQDFQHYADMQLLNKDPEVRKAFLELFNATDMNIMDFPYYFADIPLTWTETGRRKLLCPILENIMKSGKSIREQIKMLAQEAKNIGFTPESYKFQQMQNITIDPMKNHRQWYYQVCTTFGWFQSAYQKNPIRWTGMNLTYWYEYCHLIYDEAFLPDDITTNLLMAGVHIAQHTSNTYFTHGIDDGWKYAGVHKQVLHNNKKIVVNEIDCEICGHCQDLKPANENDPAVLKAARKEEIDYIAKWLA